jgi:hypothetical protein
MIKEFVPYELALKLKELGFNEPCFGYYFTLNGTDWNFADNYEFYQIDDQLNIGYKFTLLAPTWQQAFRWFRENYDLEGIPQRAEWNTWYKFWIYELHEDCKIMISNGMQFNTYEEAELACLDKLIEIVELKEKKNEDE